VEEVASQWAVEEFSLAAVLVDITEVPEAVAALVASAVLVVEAQVVAAQAEAGDS